MDKIQREDIERLLQVEQFPCASLYMPTVRLSDQVQQNPIRFKNILRKAEDELINRGLRKPDAEELLTPAAELEYDPVFWNEQSDGLAVFIAKGVYETYRLPHSFGEEVVVNDRFYLKPLYSLLEKEGHFYILALSQKQVRMLEGDRYDIREIELEDVPQSLAEALQWDEYEQHIQLNYSSGSSIDGVPNAMYHGHAENRVDNKDRIRLYFQKVDAGISELLAEERAPLVLAGVEYILPIYRQASSYNYMVDETITGNPENLRPEELHQRAWEILEPYFERNMKESADLVRIGQAHGKASTDLKEIVEAAFMGRVERLFISKTAARWGKFNQETGKVLLKDGPREDYHELYDMAAKYTFLNRGMIFAVDPGQVPGEGSIAAVFRY